MKYLKSIFISTVVILLAYTSVSAASGSYFTGPSNNLKFEWFTSYNVSGDYIDAKLEGYGNKKKVFARMGEQGTYSNWVGATEFSAHVVDYGPFGAIGNGNYEAYPQYD